MGSSFHFRRKQHQYSPNVHGRCSWPKSRYEWQHREMHTSYVHNNAWSDLRTKFFRNITYIKSGMGEISSFSCKFMMILINYSLRLPNQSALPAAGARCWNRHKLSARDLKYSQRKVLIMVARGRTPYLRLDLSGPWPARHISDEPSC